MKKDAINFESEKVSVLFRRLLIPTLLGTLSMSAMTAIDGIFIGHGVGASGVAAVNIVVPIYQIMSGIGLMIGVGCSVVASIHIARKNEQVARLNITQAISVTSLFTILLCTLMLILPTATAKILGTSDTLLPQVLDYMKWLMPSFLFNMFSMIGLFIIRLDGSPRYAMWCNIIPAIFNIILDWLFIFPLGMGVKGAAIATAINIVIGGIIAILYLLFYAKNLYLVPLKISRKSIILAFRNIGYQCKIGSSTLLGELTLAILIFIGNIVFMKYLGDDGVGAFGIACYYTPFFFMIGNAIAQSAQPIISYNYGANRWDEIREARRLLLTTSLVIGAVMASLFFFIPDKLVALFVAPNSNAGEIAIHGFPYYSIGVVFFILNVAIIGYYQSIEKIKKATLLVFLRGLILLIPIFILLPKIVGIKGIWLAMPVAKIITFTIIGVVFVLTRLNKTKC